MRITGGVGKMKVDVIYNEDCLEGMKRLPDESIDLIVTSPPYNLGDDHHTGSIRHKIYDDDMNENEYQSWQIAVLRQCFRVLKNTGSMFYNHKNRIKNGKQITPYEWLLKSDFVIKQEIVWQNGSQNFDNIRFYPTTERVYWLAKKRQTRMFNKIKHNDFFSQAKWTPLKVKQTHTRAFPLQMVKDILSCFENANIILDPFMGIGTTAVACVQLGRHYIGFEIDSGCCEIARKRLLEVQLELIK